ncbi:MAG TPA: hypothetical protein VL443_24450 [Cyclobacteriaceae bacterium]|jgi:hypothetical protein|nr:hypothetical protein [Cyclobacteriaceae bacterium]
MRKLFTILLTIAIVAVLTGLTEANTVKKKSETSISAEKLYLVHDFSNLTFSPKMIPINLASSSIDYGWQNCKCYNLYGCGTAFCAVLVANSYCINNGHPKPAGCK